jgi:hypothetical protein
MFLVAFIFAAGCSKPKPAPEESPDSSAAPAQGAVTPYVAKGK